MYLKNVNSLVLSVRKVHFEKLTQTNEIYKLIDSFDPKCELPINAWHFVIGLGEAKINLA